MEIEFRGISALGGHTTFGLLTKKKTRANGEINFALASGDCSGRETVPIRSQPINQLATRDSDGRKVYTGDIVHADTGEDYFVELRPVFVNVDGGETLINPPAHFVLKEKNHEL